VRNQDVRKMSLLAFKCHPEEEERPKDLPLRYQQRFFGCASASHDTLFSNLGRFETVDELTQITLLAVSDVSNVVA
jgi:hypothetical protein